MTKKKYIPTIADMEKQDELRRERMVTCRHCGMNIKEHYTIVLTRFELREEVYICPSSIFEES